MNDHILLNVTL